MKNNYLISFCICLALSVMSALSDGASTKWLFISDANVAVFLLLAWLIDPHRSRP
jgi:hypothetical protein